MGKKTLALAVLLGVLVAAPGTPAAAERRPASSTPVALGCPTEPARQAQPDKDGSVRGVCFRHSPPLGAKAKRPHTTTANALQSCPAPTPETWWTTRTTTCMYMSGWLELFVIDRFGRVITTGSIEMTLRVNSDTSANSGTWTMHVTAQAGDAEGTGLRGVNMWMEFACIGIDCNASGFLPRQVISPFGTQSGDGSFRSTVTEPDEVRLVNTVVNVGFSPLEPNGIPGSLRISPLSAVRCDNAIPGADYVGCVFPDVSPTFILSSARWPASAAHVANAQASGLPGAIVPLHRLVDPELQRRNRDTACPRIRPEPFDDPPLPLPTTSCDEYPFASTWEGAYLAGGVGRTFPLCGRALPQGVTGPGWSACMIPFLDNSGSGSALGAFYRVNRVMSRDTFYVVVE